MKKDARKLAPSAQEEKQKLAIKLWKKDRPKKKQPRWLNEDYSEIKARAKAENIEIYWSDETGMRNDSLSIKKRKIPEADHKSKT